MREAVSARLREERLRLGYRDQAIFGDLAGVHRNTQSAYERGEKALPSDYLLKLAEHGVDIGYVLTGLRQDGSLGFEEKQLFEMFGKLNTREREVMMTMLSIMSGYTVNADDLWNTLKPETFPRR